MGIRSGFAREEATPTPRLWKGFLKNRWRTQARAGQKSRGGGAGTPENARLGRVYVVEGSFEVVRILSAWKSRRSFKREGRVSVRDGSSTWRGPGTAIARKMWG